MKILIASILFFSSQALAEYRIYELNLVDGEGNVVKEVTSTLDHLQYSSYFDVPNNLQVVYQDSWKCYGHTGNFKAHCDKPINNPVNEAGRLPSSLPEE